MEILAFSAILTAAAFLISSFTIFWPEYKAAKREAARSDDDARAETSASPATDGLARAGLGSASAFEVAVAGMGPGTGRPDNRHARPECMARYPFNSSVCPAFEGERPEELALAAKGQGAGELGLREQ